MRPEPARPARGGSELGYALAEDLRAGAVVRREAPPVDAGLWS